MPSLPDAALPVTVAELAGFELSAECGNCSRIVRIWPGLQALKPEMRLVDVVKRLRCQTSHCRKRVKYLVLTLEGRNIPGDRHQYTPQWLLDRDGQWTERKGTFERNFNYAKAEERNRFR